MSQSKLNGRYKGKISDGTQYTKLQPLVARLRTLDHQFADLDEQNPRKENNKDGAAAPRKATPGRTPVITQTITTSTSLPKLTAEERARCAREGLCFRCRQ